MSVPEPITPLTAYAKRGRHGPVTSTPVTIAEVRLAIVQIAAFRGRTADVAAAMESAFGLAVPEPGRFVRAGEVSMVTIAPDTWLVTTPFVEEGALADRLRAALAGLASVVDQSHGKTVLRLSGAMARSVLDKGCRIDLHPRAFSRGSAAVTPIDHVTVVLAQTDDTPTYYLVAPATLVRSLTDFLVLSAAEFGVTVG